jgi:branched-chain amino acid transport system permease protein
MIGDKLAGFRTAHILIPAILALFAILPLCVSEYGLTLAFYFFIFLVMIQMWNLLAGYSGLICICQHAFIGLGAYGLAVSSMYWGLPIWASILFGGVVAAIFSFAISYPVFRMRGMYFAIGTMVAAEIVRLWFVNWDYTNLGAGIYITAVRGISFTWMYYAALALGVASMLITWLILKSKIGLGLMAIRDDQDAAASMGVSVIKCKLFCFIVASFLTATAAGIYYLLPVFVEPYGAFNANWFSIIITGAIFGGLGYIEGPLIGAPTITLIRQLFLLRYPGWGYLLQGLIIIVVLLVFPQGIAGTLRRYKPYRNLLKKFGVSEL